VRRHYLDWLRGIAVLIMIEAHTIDSWTQVADRTRPLYAWGILIGGFGAPMFLLLAGVALALAAGSRIRKGLAPSEVAARAERRGWQIFGLAFLFRLQSWIVSGGSLSQVLLKVDILNVMGPAMVAAGVLWRLGRSDRTRALLLVAATIATAMLTPLIREWAFLGVLPDPLEWYLRPSPGRTTFTLFPWAGFLLAGAAVGLWLDRAQDPDEERPITLRLGLIGVGVAIAGYSASLLPPIYRETSFWTSSPTFFFFRVGILLALIPLAFEWNTLWRSRPSPASSGASLHGPRSSIIRDLGVSSFFVYWIHVEMVYGVPSAAIHHKLSLEQWAVAWIAFTTFLFGLVRLKQRVMQVFHASPRFWSKNRVLPRETG
jgi:uncharacterized membrane protein